jgi:hypothetical protein
MNIIDYLKYSGAVITMTLNPYHWAWIPVVRFDETNEVWTNDTFRISILFLTIRFWIDDGSW